MELLNDLVNKTIVITGATSGIGRAALRALASRGAAVIGVGRSAERCQQAKQAILAEIPAAQIEFAVADLSSQQQVRDLAAEITRLVDESGGGKIDALINNAGTVSSWYVATADGYEMQFAVNHLAPFLLTHELLPLLEKAPSGRVVTVSSGSHYKAEMHWEDVMYRKGYGCLKVYMQSKLANILFSAELNRRLGAGSSVHAYAVDPGLVNTEIGFKGTSGIEKWVWRRRKKKGISPEQAAETPIFLAVDPSVNGSGDVYWKECQPKVPSADALREDEAARLWALSERLCGITWG
jgi:NAD(P)-dependent dehydrogenase (short-subunit alcohol dehydrogenase family)